MKSTLQRDAEVTTTAGRGDGDNVRIAAYFTYLGVSWTWTLWECEALYPHHHSSWLHKPTFLLIFN